MSELHEPLGEHASGSSIRQAALKNRLKSTVGCTSDAVTSSLMQDSMVEEVRVRY